MDTKTHSCNIPGGRNMLREKKNFTIIELLVVIAIIAILVSILLPALKSARSKGMEADCLSRKKQLGLILSAYSSDFDDYLQGARGDWYPDNSDCFWESWYYYAYLPAGTINRLAACSAQDFHHKIEADPGAFRGYSRDQDGITTGLHLHFRKTVDGKTIRYRTGQLKRPSVTPYASDTRGARNSNYTGMFSFNPYSRNETLSKYGSELATGSGVDDLGFWHGANVSTAGQGGTFKVHGERAVMSFADGHAASVSLMQVILFPDEYYSPMR